MDVSPWPHGQGFSGANTWWEYLLSKTERQRLESLIGAALLDKAVCEQLVRDRDENLLAAFGLGSETRQWLRTIRADTLTQLAKAIAAAPDAPASVRTYPEAA